MIFHSLKNARQLFGKKMLFGGCVCGFLLLVAVLIQFLGFGFQSEKVMSVENVAEEAEFWDIYVRVKGASKEETVPLLLTFQGDSHWFCTYDKDWGKRKEYYGNWMCWMSHAEGKLEFPVWIGLGRSRFTAHSLCDAILVHLTVPASGGHSRQAVVHVQEDWSNRETILEKDWKADLSDHVAFAPCADQSNERWVRLRVRVASRSSIRLESASNRVLGFEKAKVDVTGETMLQFNRENKKMRQVPLKENFLMIL